MFTSCEQLPTTSMPITDEKIPQFTTLTIPQQVFTDDISQTNQNVELTRSSLYETTPDMEECHIALAGNPLDASIPDGTVLNPGEEFIKIWRIKNAGTCVWTKSYFISWFSGQNIGTDEKTHFPSDVFPGEVIEISVDMVAPQVAGIYQSNWKICDPVENCFGLGAEGAYPFWAIVEVRQLDTVTPSPTITLTPTSVVLTKGSTTLSTGDEIDLDDGDDMADIVLGESETGLVLVAINGAEIGWFGQTTPTENQCRHLLYISDSISLLDMDTSEVLCYKSTLGLPGRLKFNAIDVINGEISFEYTTWFAP